MRSSGKRIEKEGHTREIRRALILIRFALNLNKENGIVATREGDFESLRPDHHQLIETEPLKPYPFSIQQLGYILYRSMLSIKSLL